MRMHHEQITGTFLFKLAQAVLPEATMLALCGRRVRIPVTPDRGPRRPTIRR